jgi:hypothetical protein
MIQISLHDFAAYQCNIQLDVAYRIFLQQFIRLKSSVSHVVKSCSLVEVHRCFGVIYCLHLQVEDNLISNYQEVSSKLSCTCCVHLLGTCHSFDSEGGDSTFLRLFDTRRRHTAENTSAHSERYGGHRSSRLCVVIQPAK